MILSSYIVVPPCLQVKFVALYIRKEGQTLSVGLRAGPRVASKRCGRLRRATVREHRRRVSRDRFHRAGSAADRADLRLRIRERLRGRSTGVILVRRDEAARSGSRQDLLLALRHVLVDPGQELVELEAAQN